MRAIRAPLLCLILAAPAWAQMPARVVVVVPPGGSVVIEVRIGGDPSAPTGPDAPADLAAFVRGRIKSTGWSGPDLAYQAAQLATAYEAHAASSASYPSPGAMLDAVEGNVAAMFGPETTRAWRDAILGPVRDRLAPARTTADMAKAFGVIAKTLREAR